MLARRYLRRVEFGRRYSHLDPTTYEGLVAQYCLSDPRGYDGSDTLKNLNPKSNADLTLVSSPNIGGTYGIAGMAITFDGAADYGVQAEQDDETGATFWPTGYGACFDAGNARFRVAGVDLSPFASAANDYILVIHDSAGKTAFGYINVADSALALGADLVDAGAGIFTSGTYGWVAYGNNTLANDANTLKITSVDNPAGAHWYMANAVDLSANLVVGQLYKFQFDVKAEAGLYVFLELHDGGRILYEGFGTTSFVTKTWYFIAKTTTTMHMRFSSFDTGKSLWLDNITLEPVTNVGADGVLIMSTKGATQSWAYQESGIDLNAINSFEVYKSDFNIPVATDRTLLMWTKPADGQPAAADVLVGKMDATNSRLGYGLSIDTAGKVKATMSNDGAVDDQFLTDAAVFSDGAQTAFKLIGAVYDASESNIDVYINGAEVASTEGGDVSTSVFDSAAVFMIGKAADGSIYAGSIAEVMVFDIGVSAAENQRIFNAQRARLGI